MGPVKDCISLFNACVCNVLSYLKANYPKVLRAVALIEADSLRMCKSKKLLDTIHDFKIIMLNMGKSGGSSKEIVMTMVP